ncbi:MAG: squalene synthase HpnC [Minwuia sp.]|nr:squalene synthase HpnC [Minwuia sp.]
MAVQLQGQMHASPAGIAPGKQAEDENFPVGSFLLPRRLRPHVAAFYVFARAADDIADDPELAPAEKIERLDACETALTTGGDLSGQPSAIRLRESLQQTGVSSAHARALLNAFRQDARQARYAAMADLIDYCDRSAAPVGRYLLELHGEDPSKLNLADPLCAALQIINHLQDCQDDFRQMNRVYLPTTWMHESGIDETALDAAETSPALRRVLDRCLDTCDTLLSQAASFPTRLQSRRLGAESAVIMALAHQLVAALRAGDPLRDRITLSRPRSAWIAVTAVSRFGLQILGGRRS